MKIYIDGIKGKRATTYKVRVRVNKKNHCRNFKTIGEAERYKRKIANQLKDYIPSDKKQKQTCGDLIKHALNDPSNSKVMTRSRTSNLKMILDYDIAQVPVNELRGEDLTNHCLERAQDLTNPSSATLNHDVNNIIIALRLADETYNIPEVVDRLTRARKNLWMKKVIKRSTPRKRLPSSEELSQILDRAATVQDSPRVKLPIQDLIYLALETAMRRSELVKVTWKDYQPEQKTLTIRERKDPKNPIDHDILLSPDSIAIIERQPKGESNEQIFPFSPASITKSWGNICKKLNIPDLRFHDLRAEAACRYYQKGWNIVQISRQTGHKDLRTLDTFYLRLGIIEASLLS
ncbi:site-specific integrase [Vibrio coralliirubri]|uniref:site-specific integrase n=1 Tax=Vibrio coralliirubri TaxID=1516159 RepID=UPI0006310094|nr:site-specific integrase [Vibrio coralliirubri]CDT93244.1 putative Shufflon-specific DNA recombinase [Vibrio coralliirubri]